MSVSQASVYLWKKKHGKLGLTKIQKRVSCAKTTPAGSAAWRPLPRTSIILEKSSEECAEAGSGSRASGLN